MHTYHRAFWMIFSGVLCITLYLLIGFIITANDTPLSSLDTFVAQHIPYIQSTQLTPFMKSITNIGDSNVLTTIVGITIIILFLLQQWKSVSVLAISRWIILRITTDGKNFFERHRPGHMLVQASGSSYPSGHTTGATVYFFILAWSLIAMIKHKVLRIIIIAICAIITLLVGFSRIYLNVHWLSDVYGGILLASGICLIVIGINEALSISKRIKRLRIVATE